MSIKPGQQDRLTEIDHLALGVTADPDDPVVLDPQNARPDDLSGVDVDEPRGGEGQHL